MLVRRDDQAHRNGLRAGRSHSPATGGLDATGGPGNGRGAILPRARGPLRKSNRGEGVHLRRWYKGARCPLRQSARARRGTGVPNEGAGEIK